MSVQIPQAKLPNITLPTIRNVPSIPKIGCSGAQPTTLIGEQLGNLPDWDAVLHIKHRKKQLEEMIQTLIEGYVPAAERQPVWAVRVEQYLEDIDELVSELEELVAGVTAEANAGIEFANAKINEVNAAKSEVENIQEAARSPIQRLALTRCNEYITELNAQIARLDRMKSCVAG